MNTGHEYPGLEHVARQAIEAAEATRFHGDRGPYDPHLTRTADPNAEELRP